MTQEGRSSVGAGLSTIPSRMDPSGGANVLGWTCFVSTEETGHVVSFRFGEWASEGESEWTMTPCL